MSGSNGEKSPVQVGVDLGCTTCRVAYLYPGEEKAVVTVPLTFEKFRPVFPILEQVPTNRMYASCFFPGLLQRLVPDFSIAVSGQPQTMRSVLHSILEQMVQATRNFSGSEVDGLLVTRPTWLDAVGRDVLVETCSSLGDTMKYGVPAAVVTDVECICAFFQQREMAEEERATVLALSAGYSGLGMAVVRVMPRGVRVLAVDGEQGLMAGNTLDFIIMQSVIDGLEERRIVYSNVRELGTWTDLQYRAEMAKLSIRDSDGVEFDVPKALTPRLAGTLRARVVGPVFRTYVQSRLDLALHRVDNLLAEAGVAADELKYVLLEGGSMHLPGVVGGIRQRFASAQVHQLSPDAVAGGAALLIATLGAGRTEPEPVLLGSATSGYFPEVAGVPGLVLLTEKGEPEAEAGKEGGPRLQASPDGDTMQHGVPLPEPPPVETLTLTDVRSKIRNGQTDAARRDLERLAEAVSQELARLDRPAATEG